MGLSYPVDLSILQELVPHFSKFDVIHSFYGGAYLSSVGMDAVSMTRLMSSERSPAPIHVNSIAAVIPLLRGHFYVDVVIMDSIPSYDYALQSLERFEDPPSTRIEMIEAGLDMSKFDPDSVKPWSYDDNDDNKPTVTIGFVGRLTQQKQPLLFVRAVAKLQKMKCHDDRYPGLRFVMVGSGTLTNQIVSLSKELNVSVLVFESTSEVPEVLASLDIFLHLSVWDTAAYGVREAMAMRLPIVALSSNVGVASYVENEVEGILLDQDDNIVEITSLALLRLACNDTLRDSMGRSGRMKMLNASSKGDFASRHADIYVNEWRTRNEKLIVG
jgi:glycosyltransferase involved in cell wall biosynthesis